jgi:excisionase family DNA binding protein
MPSKNARMGSLWGASRAPAAPRCAATSKIYIDEDIYRSYNNSIMSTVLAPPTISIKDAAARLGVHENTVRAWFDGGILKGYMSPTGRRKVLLDSVERRTREMFGVPGSAVELGKPTAPPRQLDTLERAQGLLP